MRSDEEILFEISTKPNKFLFFLNSSVIAYLCYLVFTIEYGGFTAILFLLIITLLIFFSMSVKSWRIKKFKITKDHFIASNGRKIDNNVIYYRVKKLKGFRIAKDVPIIMLYEKVSKHRYELLSWITPFNNEDKNIISFVNILEKISRKHIVYLPNTFSSNYFKKIKLTNIKIKSIEEKEELTNSLFSEYSNFDEMMDKKIVNVLNKGKTFFLDNYLKIVLTLIILLFCTVLIWFDDLYSLYDSFIKPNKKVIDYNLGVNAVDALFLVKYYTVSLKYLLLFTVLHFLVTLAFTSNIGKNYSLLKDFVIRYLRNTLLLYSSIAATVVIFYPAIYVVINFFSQNLLNISFWKIELTNGFIFIRLASINLVVYFISVAIHKRINLHKTKYDIENTVENKISENNIYQHIYFIAFYSLILNLLIHANLNGINNILLVVSNLALFFIIDDWKIMLDYSIQYGKIILFWHRLKLLLVNSLLLICAVIISFQVFSNVGAIALSMLLISIYIAILIYFSKLQKLTSCATGS